MPDKRESIAHTLGVAGAVALVCSVVVASAAVLLKPLQEENEALNRQRNILQVAGLLDEAVPVAEAFERVDSKVVDLETGAFVDSLEPGFDPVAAARDAALGVDIPPDTDSANIGRRARYATVYFVRDGDALDTIILPIYGAGLWAKIYGFVALESDTSTISGLAFSDHGETPGLGGEIDNPRWQSLWRGKQAYGNDGTPAIEVIKGKVTASAGESAVHQIDGLSGATLTGDAITDMLRYWLGDHGYRPLLARIRAEGDRS